MDAAPDLFEVLHLQAPGVGALRVDAPASPPVRAAVFRKAREAGFAAAELVRAGFAKDHITVVCTSDRGHRFDGFDRRDPAGAHTFGAALVGGAIGAALGGVAALAGTELLLTGPLLAGIGALAGGFVGAMLSRGVEREATNYYDQAVRKGDILVAVECDPGSDQRERLALAERLLARAGARPLPLLEG
ncbi:MAG TPA: hypothetical protein VFG37_12155 [Planctomycetota bacterium]|nr:hypothetical protein [Planctomycetota bacterium]